MNKKIPGKHTVSFSAESFSIEKVETEDGEKDWYEIKGNAQPLNESSRNRVRYRKKSVQNSYESLGDVTVTFNHNENFPVGKNIESGINDTHVTYKAKLMSDVELNGIPFHKYVERGVLKHPSIQAIVSDTEYDEENDIFTCSVDEYIEMSIVTIPGFKNTSALGESGATKVLREAMNMTKEEDEKENDTKASESPESPDPMEELMERVKNNEEQFESLKSAVDNLGERVNTLEDEKKKPDDDDEEDDDEDDDEEKDDKKKKHSFPSDGGKSSSVVTGNDTPKEEVEEELETAQRLKNYWREQKKNSSNS